MGKAMNCAIGAAAIILGFAATWTSGVIAQPKAPPSVAASIDLAPFLGLGEFYVKPVLAEKDPKTGFAVGGKNATSLLPGLKTINGWTVAELEKDMRPGATSDVGSDSGFLGKDEALLGVLAEDNRYVLEDLGLTHQTLAKHLHAMGTIGFWQRDNNKEDAEFVYHGRKFKVKVETSKGYQLSPFRDGTQTDSEATIHNLENGKKLQYSLLVPYMIERYGFCEGKGTPYRVEPQRIVEVFDFLKPTVKKR